MFTRRGCSHFPRCRSGYTRQQVDVFDDRHRERAGSGIPGVFSVWHKTFGASPEYSQRTSPDRITTTLFTTQKTTFTTQKTTQEPDNTEEKNGAKVIENTSEVIENVIENTDTVEKNGAKVIENASTVIENVIENTSDVIENAVSLSKTKRLFLE